MDDEIEDRWRALHEWQLKHAAMYLPQTCEVCSKVATSISIRGWACDTHRIRQEFKVGYQPKLPFV